MAGLWDLAAAAASALGRAAFGPGTAALLLFTGGLYSCATGFFQLRGARRWWRATLGAALREKGGGARGVTPFAAACTALAATLGTGNIAGVATALAAGGPGAVFWMNAAALLGCMTAWAENFLAGLYRGKNAAGQPVGGAMYYIEKGLGCRPLALAFSFFCVLASLGMGNMAQSNSMAQSLSDAFRVPPLACGLGAAALAALVLAGGRAGVTRAAAKLVPFMAVGYTLAAAGVVAANAARLPDALALIFEQAFCPEAGLGGAAGYGVARAFRVGVARGVLSNEAGLGTSPMANAAAGLDPAGQGMWGIFEVMADTVFLCTLTALAILCSGVYDPARYAAALHSGTLGALPGGAALTAAAFRSVYGAAGGAFLAASLALFAFSTLLGWSCYGAQAAEYLAGPRAARLYRWAFLACVPLGSAAGLETVWRLADIFNGWMALPNLAALLLLAPRVLRPGRAALWPQKGAKGQKTARKPLQTRDDCGIL